MLAPYGLAGTLTGQSYKESDSNTQKVLEEWKQFFVVPDPETWELPAEHSTLPKLVEVVVGECLESLVNNVYTNLLKKPVLY